MTLDLAEFLAHIDEQERKGVSHLTISTAMARELANGYHPPACIFMGHPDISGLIRLWPFPQPKE